MCEEESEDHEAVAKLFEINDSIHRTIQRYKLTKNGDLEGASKIAKGTLGISGAGVKKGPDNELSLIDFGGADEAEPVLNSTASNSAAPSAPAPKGNALEDDLLGLSMGDGAFGSGGGISLGPSSAMGDMTASSSTYQSSQAAAAPKPNPMDFFSQPSQPVQQAPSQAVKANLDLLAGFGGSQPMSSHIATPTPQTIAQPAAQHHQHKAADPFASLASSSRTTSPFQFQQPFKAPASPAPAHKSRPTSLIANNGAAAADDEWTFSSALPPQQHDVTVTNSAIKTVFHVSRPANATDYIEIQSRISNNTAQVVSDLTFQLAVTKVCPFLHFIYLFIVLYPGPTISSLCPALVIYSFHHHQPQTTREQDPDQKTQITSTHT